MASCRGGETARLGSRAQHAAEEPAPRLDLALTGGPSAARHTFNGLAIGEHRGEPKASVPWCCSSVPSRPRSRLAAPCRPAVRSSGNRRRRPWRSSERIEPICVAS
jgi:hypothetical protein